MRNITFILFVLVNLGFFQCYNCLRNIRSENISNEITSDEFNADSAHQYNIGKDNDQIPFQKKKRKRIRNVEPCFTFIFSGLIVNHAFYIFENNHLPEPVYNFKKLYSGHKRGPPVAIHMV